MNQYEVMYIIDTALEDQARADLVARFSGLVESNGGQVDRVDEWGKRRLAYAIDYKTEGYYVLMYITAPTDLPRELERNFKISESVLRYLVIRFEGALPPKREPLRPYTPSAPTASAGAQDGEEPGDGEQPPAEAGAEAAPAPEAETPADEPAADEAAPAEPATSEE